MCFERGYYISPFFMLTSDVREETGIPEPPQVFPLKQRAKLANLLQKAADPQKAQRRSFFTSFSAKLISIDYQLVMKIISLRKNFRSGKLQRAGNLQQRLDADLSAIRESII